MFQIKTVKEQAALQDQILKERLDFLLPKVMANSEADAWIIASKEYHEDLLFPLLVPASYLTARRITILAFVKDHGNIRRFSISLPDEDLEQYYEPYYDYQKESQIEALNRLFCEFDVQHIAWNTSEDSAFADGLSSGLYKQFQREIDDCYVEKFMEDKLLAIKLMEIRTETEKSLYPHVLEAAFSVIEDTFSKASIVPGVTTCADLEWHMKQKVQDMGLTFWFSPTIDLQREGEGPRYYGVIEKGDLLHCDFGIRYMNLCTDTQRNAYVAKDGETQLPEKIRKGFAVNNRFQDIVRENFALGRTGNEVFTAAITQAKKEGIKPCLYSHPCNVYGHGPGTIMGLYTNQNEIPIRGDICLDYDTVFALELNIQYEDMTFYSEETVLFDESGVHFLYPGRDEIYWIQ